MNRMRLFFARLFRTRPWRAGSLFVKIFVWFWTAMTLAGIVLLAIEASRTRELSRRWWGVTGDAFATYAVTSAQALEDENRTPQKGGQKLDEYFQELEKRTRIRAQLLDEQGQQISKTGQAVPLSQPRWLVKRTRELAARAKRSGQTEFDPLGGMTLVARLAVSPQGRRYILIGQLPAAQYGPWIPNPQVQAKRLLAVLLTAALVCWGLGRHLTSPIVMLRAATRRLAQGDFSARAAAGLQGRNDELASLARDFDLMAEHIQALLREQERLLAEQKLLMGAQRRLLGDVSHELRSPLARASVALEMARDRADTAQTPAGDVRGRRSTLGDAHDRIEREMQHLNDMIDRLLTLSRLESGVQQAESTPVDLEDVVRDVVADADFEARPNRRVVSIVACDNCTTRGTPDLLRSAIENVVRNALHYTAEDTSVEVSLRKLTTAPDKACATENVASQPASVTESSKESSTVSAFSAPSFAVITVRDHGPGVPEAELKEMFRPFHRLRGINDRQIGAGLGLAITARAVELHGGQVRAFNAEDGGLIVEIRLLVEGT